MLVVITVLRFLVILRMVSHRGLSLVRSCLFYIQTIYKKNMYKELEVLADWFHANKLSLNVSKTKYMLFSRYHPVQREETVLTMSI